MLEFLETLATNAGEICLRESKKMTPDHVDLKKPKDLVTAVDRMVEEYITREIKDRFPDHDIFGEETGKTQKGSSMRWVIDPIDGTTSYVHGQPFYAVSIALEKNGTAEYGAVYAPVSRELFMAEKGKGATLNGKKISVSDSEKLVNSVLATGFACLRAGAKDNNLKHFNLIAPEIRDIRRYGSAAMDLAYVACGRVDGFWEMMLNPYDIAAGALLVTEAGGMVCDFEGGESYPEKGILATNGKLTEELLDLLSRSDMS